MTPGELGIFASHTALWRWLLAESDLDALCVLEDDVIVDRVFFGRLATLYAREKWLDYVRLYAKVPVPFTYVKEAFGRHLVRFRLPVFGAQGYLISRAGAATFLRSIRAVVRPIDDEMDRFWAHGLPIYCVYPFPLMESDLGSTIEPSRRRYASLTPTLAARRLAFRASEKARRFASNLIDDAQHRLKTGIYAS
jgi:glycosyl transferase family 25